MNLKFLDTCFYVDNAIRKVQESLFSYPYPIKENYVSRNKIGAVINVIYAIICELKTMQNLPQNYEEEISRLQLRYGDTIESISNMYGLKLKSFK
mgnify:CR=1 FL=1